MFKLISMDVKDDVENGECVKLLAAKGDENMIYAKYQQKPKGILVNTENRPATKRSKPKRFVSWSLDEDKEALSSVYFGVKSYLHNFYEPISTKFSGRDTTEDDFEFSVEPGKRKNRCFRFLIFLGMALIIGGIALVIFGHLAPRKDPIIGADDSLEIYDKWAASFNQRVERSKLGGLVVLGLGGLVLIFVLAASYERECTRITHGISSETNPWIRYSDDPFEFENDKIPVSREIKIVQMESDN